MANVLKGLTAKDIFLKSFIAVYKDRDVTLQQLSQWIKLSLKFEDPTKTLNRGMLYTESVPKYAEIFQTGICVFGFGVQTRQLAALRKYWSHEWILDMILGHHTVHNYIQTPLIQYDDYSHVTEDLINYSIQKYVGEIEQINPSPIFFENADDNDDDDTSQTEEEEKNIRDGPWPTLRKCYSIKMLQKNDKIIKFRIFSDGLFNCRAFVRDLSMDIGCQSSIDSLHLAKVGPISSEQALKKHELHYEHFLRSAEMITPSCQEYLLELRQQYPLSAAGYRHI